jgi:hypothetical protein
VASSHQILGNGYVWIRGDPLPELPPLPGFRVAPAAQETELLARLATLPVAEVSRRIDTGNVPYLAWIGDVPVAYGWSTANAVRDTGGPRQMILPPGYHYLWDFVTLPEWRGRGIYPRLLQAIFALDTGAAAFTIGHNATNTASRQGILRAGFRHTLDLVVLPGGDVQLLSVDGSLLPVDMG